MRILSVTHFYESHGGGIEIVAGHLAREFGGLGHTSIWAASQSDEPPSDSRITTRPLATFDLLERLTGLPMPVPFPLAAWRLWREAGRADALVIHDGLYVTSILAAISARWHKRPYVLIQHIGEIPFANGLLRRLMRCANAIATKPVMRGAAEVVFISETVRRYFAGVGLENPPRLIFNGVDTARFRLPEPGETADEKAAFHLSDSRPTLLFVGRFVDKKGLGILREIARRLPGHDIVLAGQGPMRPETWGLANVRVLGALAPSDLARLYRGADALVLPSTGEGYPLVVQEAMASGLPVFCGEETAMADPGAAAHLVGCPVDLSRPAESAACFSEAVRSHSLTRSPAAAAYATATYSWPRNGERLSRIFEQLVIARTAGEPQTA